MNKDLVLLQKKCKTAAIVLDSERKALGRNVVMKASVSDSFLFGTPLGKPPFAEKLDKYAGEIVSFFVISGFDKVTPAQQERFVGLVKDREFNGYTLPENCIVVFTVMDENGLKSIAPDLYRLCVNAL